MPPTESPAEYGVFVIVGTTFTMLVALLIFRITSCILLSLLWLRRLARANRRNYFHDRPRRAVRLVQVHQNRAILLSHRGILRQSVLRSRRQKSGHSRVAYRHCVLYCGSNIRSDRGTTFDWTDCISHLTPSGDSRRHCARSGPGTEIIESHR